MKTIYMSFMLAVTVGMGNTSAAQIEPEWVVSHRSGDTFEPVRHATAPDGSTFSVATVETGGQDAIALVRFNPDGSFAWQQDWDGSTVQDIAAGVSVSPDGAFVYVLGRTHTPNRSADFAVLKYDAQTGGLIWAVLWDGGEGNIDDPRWITTLPDGAVVATGSTWVSGFRLDYASVCIEPDGTVRWDATFRGSGRFLFDDDVSYFAKPTPDGHVVVFGLASLFNGNEFRTIKYNAQSGAQLWSASYSLATGPRDLAVADNGDVVVFGEDPLGIDRRWTVVRYDGTTGAELWQTSIDPGFDEGASGVTIDINGDVYCTGRSDPDGNDSNNNENWITIALEGQTGNIRWLDEFGTTGRNDFETGSALWIDSAGSLNVVGFVTSDDLIGDPYRNDATIRRLDPMTGVQTDIGFLDLTDDQTRSDRYRRVGFDAGGNAYVHGSSSGAPLLLRKSFVAKFPAPSNCPADFNDDGDVNTLDVLAFLNAWNANESRADFNQDGDINTLDVLAFLNAWNTGC